MSSFKKYFKKGIKKFYPLRSAAIMADTDRHFKRLFPDVVFARSSSNPMDRRLVFSAYFLALILALEDRGESFDRIKAVCLDITTDYVSPHGVWQRLLKKIPPHLIGTRLGRYLLSSFARKIGSTGHADGFRASILTDKESTHGLGYGVDILECGICKLFAKHGASKYASVLCEVDKLTSGLAGLELIRSGTIANGAEKCDFRWRKMG